MKEIEITHAMLIRARNRAAKLPKLKNSIRNQKGKLVGLLGEEIVKKFLGIPVKQDKASYDYDLIDWGDQKIEVKTKERSVAPKPEYECSVALYNAKQDCDLYVFVCSTHRINEIRGDSVVVFLHCFIFGDSQTCLEGCPSAA